MSTDNNKILRASAVVAIVFSYLCAVRGAYEPTAGLTVWYTLASFVSGMFGVFGIIISFVRNS